ncbi:hypothetical protein [Halovivax gelatinilyticus]|uniref:hypothetical protein n=1 Tax=Halovivax gelatinilyticus TaxID=2961597 RepID=UPI0020CA32DF|nr:hypothetical protein [Halovivax gelatinilyticus]
MGVVLLVGVVNDLGMNAPQPTENSTDMYEFVVRDDGRLELRHLDHADEWIASDEPVEVLR